MCNPAVHRSEWNAYKERYTNPNKLGSAEYIINVDDENHVIKKQDRLPPDFENEEFDLNFNDDVLKQTKEIVNNSFHKIVEPYSQDERNTLLERWIENVSLAYHSTLKDDYYKNYPAYKEALKRLHSELKRIRDTLIEVQSENTPFKPIDRDWVEKMWKELIKQGNSEHQAAKKISNMLDGAKSISTIKRWCKPEYNR